LHAPGDAAVGSAAKNATLSLEFACFYWKVQIMTQIKISILVDFSNQNY